MNEGNPFERYFAGFVKHAGGEVIAELDTIQPDAIMADYYFAEYHAIAELSSFIQDDSSRTDTMMLEAILQWGGDMNTIPISYDADDQPYVAQEDLPEEIRAIWVDRLSAEVEQNIINAQEKIAATKEAFNLPDAHGVILVPNASKLYYAYPSSYSKALFASVLRQTSADGDRMYPEIDGGVCFSARHLERNEKIPSWAPFHIEGPTGTGAEVQDFLSFLNREWFAFVDATRFDALTAETRQHDDQQPVEEN
jgi:Fe-S-cluster formation regulator IscX/YfhJ